MQYDQIGNGARSARKGCEAPSRGFVAERAVRSPGNRAIALDGQSRVGNGCYYLRLAEGAVVFVKACELGLEGIVSKRAASIGAGEAVTD
jgi:hypothetical protein